MNTHNPCEKARKIFQDSIQTVAPSPDNAGCTICLRSWQENDRIVRGKSCTMHEFHYDCLFEWIIQPGTSCPICRTEIFGQKLHLFEPNSAESTFILRIVKAWLIRTKKNLPCLVDSDVSTFEKTIDAIVEDVARRHRESLLQTSTLDHGVLLGIFDAESEVIMEDCQVGRDFWALFKGSEDAVRVAALDSLLDQRHRVYLLTSTDPDGSIAYSAIPTCYTENLDQEMRQLDLHRYLYIIQERQRLFSKLPYMRLGLNTKPKCTITIDNVVADTQRPEVPDIVYIEHDQTGQMTRKMRPRCESSLSHCPGNNGWFSNIRIEPVDVDVGAVPRHFALHFSITPRFLDHNCGDIKVNQEFEYDRHHEPTGRKRTIVRFKAPTGHTFEFGFVRSDPRTDGPSTDTNADANAGMVADTDTDTIADSNPDTEDSS